MLAVASIVVPVFAIILLGVFAGARGLFDETANRALAYFVFYVAAPCLLLKAMAEVELPEQLPWAFLLGYYGATLSVYGLALVLGRLESRDQKERALGALASTYSNNVLLGIPLVLLAFGEPGLVAHFTLLAFHSPILFVVTTMLIERDDHDSVGDAVRLFGRQFFHNPIIGAMAIGILINLATIDLPKPVSFFLSTVGAATPGCSLFAIGVGLSLHRIGRLDRELAGMVALKGLLHPALVAVAVFVLLPVDALWAKVAVTAAAMPTGINAYVFAQRYGAMQSIVSRATAISTALSFVVVSLAFRLMGIA